MLRARFTYQTFRFINPIAGVRIGLIEGRYIINPTYDEVRESRLNLIVAGTEEAIVMVEAGAQEVSEEIMVEALMLAHKEINRLCRWQKELYKALEIQKREVVAVDLNEEMLREIKPRNTATDCAKRSIRRARKNAPAMRRSTL